MAKSYGAYEMIKIVKELESGKKDVFTLKDNIDSETLRKIEESFPKTLRGEKKISEGNITASFWKEIQIETYKHPRVYFIKFTRRYESVGALVGTNRLTLDDLPAIVSLATRVKGYIKGVGYKESNLVRKVNAGRVELSIWIEKQLIKSELVTRYLMKLTKFTWDGDKWNPTDRFNLGDLPEIEELGKKLKDV